MLAATYYMAKHMEFYFRMEHFSETLGVCQHRRAACTTDGLMALVPGMTEPGDIVMIFSGAKAPFIVRPTDQHRVFTFIGEAYVHGIMDGERFDEALLDNIELA